MSKDINNIKIFEDPKVLEEFLENPLSTIAVLITGAYALGKKGAVLSGLRIFQGALKGKIYKQFSLELNSLIEKGQIPKDYAEKKFGFKSLIELLEFIDSEIPDDDRIKAIKDLFYSINLNSISEGDRLARYQLFQIVKKLNSSQLLLLKTSYKLYLSNELKEKNEHGHDQWLKKVADIIGHNITALIEQDENILMESNLLTKRIYSDKSGINTDNGRLTDMGIQLCKLLDINYSSL